MFEKFKTLSGPIRGVYVYIYIYIYIIYIYNIIYIYIYTAKYNKKTNVYRNKYTHWQMAFICIFIFFIHSMRWYSLLTKWSWKRGEIKLSSQLLKGSCKHASYLRRNDIIILHTSVIVKLNGIVTLLRYMY